MPRSGDSSRKGAVNDAFAAMMEFLKSSQSKVQQEGFRRTIKSIRSTEDGPTKDDIQNAFEMLQKTREGRDDPEGLEMIKRLWAI